MAIAQTGQYNFLRMAKREDWVTVQAVLTRFCDNVIGLVFLLNSTFRPFYKWAYHRMKELGEKISVFMYDMTLIEGFTHDAIMKRNELITNICSELAAELNRQELTNTDDWFFTTHGEQLQQKIKDSFLSSLPPQYE